MNLKAVTSPPPNTATLLSAVHRRLGYTGFQITIDDYERIRVQWRRDYGEGVLSDQRTIWSSSIDAALLAVIDYEDDADQADTTEQLHAVKPA